MPRSRLAPHLIQRKRTDLQRWLGVDTPFPEREAVDRSYQMSADYHRLYQDILTYCREYVFRPRHRGATPASSVLGRVVDLALRSLQPNGCEGSAGEPQAVFGWTAERGRA